MGKVGHQFKLWQMNPLKVAFTRKKRISIRTKQTLCARSEIDPKKRHLPVALPLQSLRSLVAQVSADLKDTLLGWKAYVGSRSTELAAVPE
ncbi:hypothetical protein [Marinobacter antarcticus]|uniref:hypothetical protein n=1 Tax=Marinobacter antarcticus TaxID=564117 RepID=UPI0026F2F9DE|nr:hypothetical protein [Marinobacter antarcticus]